MPVTEFAKLQKAHGIEIPDNILVPCPISGKQVRRFAAKCCPDCEHFDGLGKLTYADTDEESAEINKAIKNKTLSWSRVYAIRCVCVMEWITEEISE